MTVLRKFVVLQIRYDVLRPTNFGKCEGDFSGSLEHSLVSLLTVRSERSSLNLSDHLRMQNRLSAATRTSGLSENNGEENPAFALMVDTSDKLHL